jgi:hypothetical protein
MLVFGSSIGEGNYTRPQGEIVYMEASDELNNYGGGATVSSNTSINIEAETNGTVPKGAKALLIKTKARCSTAAKDFRISNDTSTTNPPLLIGSQQTSYDAYATCWVPCDSNGDIAVTRNDTFTNVGIHIHAVELR